MILRQHIIVIQYILGTVQNLSKRGSKSNKGSLKINNGVDGGAGCQFFKHRERVTGANKG